MLATATEATETHRSKVQNKWHPDRLNTQPVILYKQEEGHETSRIWKCNYVAI